MFWAAVYACTSAAFKAALTKIRELKAGCAEYIEAIPATSWATYAFPAPRYGHITSNIVESANSMWKDARELPALELLVRVWQSSMTTFYERNQLAQSTTTELLTPSAKNWLHYQYTHSGQYYIMYIHQQRESVQCDIRMALYMQSTHTWGHVLYVFGLAREANAMPACICIDVNTEHGSIYDGQSCIYYGGLSFAICGTSFAHFNSRFGVTGGMRSPCICCAKRTATKKTTTSSA